jgi:hypothetical protein
LRGAGIGFTEALPAALVGAVDDDVVDDDDDDVVGADEAGCAVDAVDVNAPP